jgi:IclR family acetate operon transcriptional repressor
MSIHHVKSTREPTRIRSVAKAMQLLMRIAEVDMSSARQAADALGLPVATAHHLLETLVAEGMLSKYPHRGYELGPRIGALADAFHRRNAPSEFLLAPLRRLSEETGETAYLSGRRWDDAVVLASAEGSQAVRVSALHTGYHGHNHARASGKLLLAFGRPEALDGYLAAHELSALTPSTITDESRLRQELDDIRARGHAVDHEEFTPGVSCVAAPVLEADIAIAAYAVAVPTERFQQRFPALKEAVLRAAAAAATDAPSPVAKADREGSR